MRQAREPAPFLAAQTHSDFRCGRSPRTDSVCWRSRLESSSSSAHEVHQMDRPVSQRDSRTFLGLHLSRSLKMWRQVCLRRRANVTSWEWQMPRACRENRSPSGPGLGFLGHRLEWVETKQRKPEFRFRTHCSGLGVISCL